MPAYWVARSKINDPVEYKKYTDQVRGIIAKFGGKVLARGGRYEIMEGPHKFNASLSSNFPRWSRASPASNRRNTTLLRPSGAAVRARWKR